ncbi:hypothetical protein VNI00_015086 [Paramarasmius palmivorus]|uniref:Gustatory receptor n=1 Tax=Paramarasmius palmivorus TaxID=297713 RepID=A0AAW0BNN9_9AGAR
MSDTSLRTSFLLSLYLEGWAYGFLLCLYACTLYIKFNVKILGYRDTQTMVMFVISTVMFFIATFHVIMNMYRLLRAFSDNCGRIRGPELYLGRLNRWDHVLKDTLYATQEILGNAAAVYRTWILWGKSWKIIAFPTVMLIAKAIAGYMTCSIFAHVDPTHNVFDPHLNGWIKTFWSLSVALNIITTALMAYRIWSTHRLSLTYSSGKIGRAKSRLLPIIWVLVESAALQLIAELILLGLYCNNSEAQYVVLELITPIVGITFNAITIRLKLYAIEEEVHPIHSLDDLTCPRSSTVLSVPLQDLRQNEDMDVERKTVRHSQL